MLLAISKPKRNIQTSFPGWPQEVQRPQTVQLPFHVWITKTPIWKYKEHSFKSFI